MAPAPAGALFHFAHIAEVNARGGNDPTNQYVEIVMESSGQNLVANSVLSAWDCAGNFLGDLLVVPGNVISGDNRRWIMATKNPVGGIMRDFQIPNAGIPLVCGQVCWGAPGSLPPADPNSWSRSNLSNFVDCVAYGPYTGPTRLGSGAPSPLTPGDGTYSLVRINDTTLAAACPSPQNNANDVGSFGPCTPPGSTSTSTSSSSTTSSSTTTTTSTTTSSTVPLCGNGVIDSGEQCDDTGPPTCANGQPCFACVCRQLGDCQLDGNGVDLFDILLQIDLLLGQQSPSAGQSVVCDDDCDDDIDLFDVLRGIDAVLGRVALPLTCPSPAP